jgi:hypothetical protein
MKSNYVEELSSLGGDQHNASPDLIESKGAIEIHSPVFPGKRGRRLLCFSPFHPKVHQALGLDHRLWDIYYVELHEIKCPTWQSFSWRGGFQ